MRVLIVEDELGALADLKIILREADPSVEVAGTTESVLQTVAWLEKHPAPDLIFMDIHLSDGSAFEIFRRTKIVRPVVFTTAFDEYAIKAFRVNAIDYLLKPVSVDEMRRVLLKYDRMNPRPLLRDHDRAGDTSPRHGSGARYLLIAYQDKLLPVPVERISFFYSTKFTSKVYLDDGRSFAYNKTLESICRELNPRLFRRVNKQFVVAKNHIRNIVVWSNSRLRLAMDIETPEQIFLNKNRVAEFKKWMTD